MHHLRHARIERLSGSDVPGHTQWLDFIPIIMREVSKHAASIRRLPPENFHGELVGVVPSHFLSYKVVDSRFLVYLRKLPVVSKRIRVPSNSDIDAKFVFEIFFPN